MLSEWLAAKLQIDYLNLINQLLRYFKSPNAFDIMISTCGEFGFEYEHGKTNGTSTYMHDIAHIKSFTVSFIIGGSAIISNLNFP